MWRSVLVVMALLVGGSALANPNTKAAEHYKQGKAFLDAKLYDEAIVEFEAAYAIDKLPSHLFNLASAYEAKGDADRALELYTKFVAAEPKSPNAAQARVQIALLTKAKKEAEEKRRMDQEVARVAAEKQRAAEAKQRDADVRRREREKTNADAEIEKKRKQVKEAQERRQRELAVTTAKWQDRRSAWKWTLPLTIVSAVAIVGGIGLFAHGHNINQGQFGGGESCDDYFSPDGCPGQPAELGGFLLILGGTMGTVAFYYYTKWSLAAPKQPPRMSVSPTPGGVYLSWGVVW